MKKFNLLLIVVFLASYQKAFSQTTILFSESFDGPTINMVDSSTSNLNAWGLHWVNVSSPYSDTGRVMYKDTIYLTTPIIDITGKKSVVIEFDHVAKIHNNDDAYIQISLDSQKNWITLTNVEHQSGSILQARTGSPAAYLFNEFSGFPLNNIWQFPIPANNQQMISWGPLSANDFVHEVFEISNHLSTSTTNLSVRFVLGDNYNQNQSQTDPSQGRAGWWVDNVQIRGAECLLIAPKIDLSPPNKYINQYIGSVYWQGPFDFTAEITDGEGIDEAWLYYKVNNGPEDSIQFVHQFGATYYAEIPRSAVQLLDTVCWRIAAYDVTACRNVEFYPSPTVGCFEFEVRRDLPQGCETTPKNVYPYIEDFNGQNCIVGNSGVLCNDWTNATGDFGDWYVHVGSTPISGTGPDTDYPGGGKYLYINSDEFTNNTSNLKSPCLDFFEIENPNVRFYVNTYGQSTGKLHVDLLTFDGPTTLDIIPPIPTSTTPGWQQVEFNLFQYRNKIVQLRFRGKTGFNNLSDIAIDSLSIFNSPLYDISAVSVEVDELAPAKSNDSVSVSVRNLGVYPIDSINVYLSYNEQGFGNPVLINGLVAPGETKQFKLKSNLEVPLGEYTIQAAIKLVRDGVEGDPRAYNDTTQLTIGRGLPTIDLINNNEYFDSFEDTNHLWTAFPFNNFNTNRWEHGVPNYGQTSGAFDGNYAWDINLNIANTNKEETAYLISPFMDLTNSQNLLLQFMQNRNINKTDLLYVQYSRDRGKTWHFFTSQDPFEKNWQTDNVLLPTNELAPGWNGTSMTYTAKSRVRDNWKLSEHNIQILADTSKGRVDEVLLRFGFYDQAIPSDGGGDGVSIDAVRIINRQAYDVGPIEVVTPFSHCLLTMDSIEVMIQNFGTTYFDSLFVEVNVYEDGVVGATQNFTEFVYDVALQPRDTGLVKLKNRIDLSNIGKWYTIEIITHYESAHEDMNHSNDTIRKRVENIDGCFMKLVMNPLPERPAFDHLGHYQFYINGKIPEYPSYMHFRTDFEPLVLVCARDSSDVLFELYDPFAPPSPVTPDLRNIGSFSLFNDLINEPIRDRMGKRLQNVAGGSKTIGFHMDCPPVRSTVVNDNSLRVIDAGILPTAREYNFELTWRNMGIEDIAYIEMQLWVDEDHRLTDTVRFPSANTGAPIVYSEYFQHVFDRIFVGPGRHTITAIMARPNELLDEEPWDDTARIQLHIVDTSYTVISDGGYLTSFESNARPQWVSLNPYTYTTNSLFEKGMPSKSIINSVYDGNNAWVTDLDDPYRPFDSSSVVSPYFLFEKNVCYQISFQHLYVFGDNAQDGGNFQYTLDTGKTWITITDHLREPDTTQNPLFKNWNNVHHIAAIPFNNVQNPADPFSYYNSGWSGVSDSLGNYHESKAPLGFYGDQYVVFRFNFESDGPPNGEGWAIDYFKIDTIPQPNCFTVGIEELLAKHAFVLGNNKPNPFNSQSMVPVYLPKSGEVTVEILNMMGQPVYQSREIMGKGDHLIPIQNDGWASGIYYYSVTFDGDRQTKKMMITK